jgi:hypothetical protein
MAVDPRWFVRPTVCVCVVLVLTVVSDPERGSPTRPRGRARVRLEAELSIGRAVADDREERSFTGWPGLMTAVRALIVEDGGERLRPVGEVDRGCAEGRRGEGTSAYGCLTPR